jgi:signal transduction histidine kinase
MVRTDVERLRLVRRELARRRLAVEPDDGVVGEHALGHMRPTARRAASRVSPTVRVWTLTVVLAAASVGMWIVLRRTTAPLIQGPHIPWWLLAVGFGLAEVFVMHLRIARDAHSFSLSEIPLVLAIAFASPGVLLTAQAVGIAVALTVHRRQKPLRVAFNVAQRSVTASIAFAVVALGTSVLGVNWLAIWGSVFVGTISTDVLGGVLINSAIRFSEGSGRLFDQVVGVGTALTFANTSLALVATMVVIQHPAAIVLVSVPAATTFLAGKAYADLRRKHENLNLLQRSTRLVQRSLRRDEMIPGLLEHVREMFNADIAEFVLWPADDEHRHVVYRLGPGDDAVADADAARLDPTEGVWGRIASEREPILLARPIRNDALRRFYGDAGIEDAIVAPVMSEDELLGILTVANRLGDFSTFDGEDLDLLATLANHVGVALRNSLLLERLETTLAHETEIGRLKDDFVATISHELRTPLTNVQGYLRTLIAPGVALTRKEEEEFLRSADRNAERLKRLIEDLLFASRVEASGPLRAAAPIGIAGLLERIVSETGDGSQRIVLSVSELLPPVESCEEDVYRIVRNLVDNALKYSPIDAAVTVSARAEGEGVTIRVRDSGCGVDPEEQQRIFERFYQVDQSITRRVGGAGMGLYICRRAAEQLGGRVWLDRSDASGSVFAVWLPIDRPVQAVEASGTFVAV